MEIIFWRLWESMPMACFAASCMSCGRNMWQKINTRGWQEQWSLFCVFFWWTGWFINTTGMWICRQFSCRAGWCSRFCLHCSFSVRPVRENIIRNYIPTGGHHFFANFPIICISGIRWSPSGWKKKECLIGAGIRRQIWQVTVYGSGNIRYWLSWCLRRWR